MALSTLKFDDNNNAQLAVTRAAAYGDATAPTYKASFQAPQINLSKNAANNAVGGADQVYSALLSIAGSGNTTIDLQSFTNFAGETSCSFTRIKYLMIRLLSVEDDATNGSACSGITVEPDASNGWTGLLAAAGDKITLGNGDMIKFGTRRAAGVTVGASNKVLKITNTDGSVAAKVQVTIVGGSS